MTGIKIVSCGAKEAARVAPLFDAYRRFYKQPSDPNGARRFISERLKRKESVVFLAVAGADCIGFVQLYPTFSSIAMKRLWILNDLFVAPNARRKGAARALLMQAERLARATGAEGLCLETAVDNRKARRLYEKLGWKREIYFYRYDRTL